MASDYRNSIYCPVLEDVRLQKIALRDDIHQEHPRLRITYNQVKDKDGPYRKRFVHIFNCKCAYCGNSIKNISSDLFEIDHYIHESSFGCTADAGRMENLVLACYDCNRAKGSLLIEEEYRTLLHPELTDLKDIFIRDDQFYIRIAEEYQSDVFIQTFYRRLKFGYQTRRLDYLLLNLRGLCLQHQDTPLGKTLYQLLNKLQCKRNLIGCIRLKDEPRELSIV